MRDPNVIVLALHRPWFGEDRDGAHMGIRAAAKNVALAGDLPATAADYLSRGPRSASGLRCVARALRQHSRLVC
jgi:hypothetical protein